jgi:hypothetical protein
MKKPETNVYLTSYPAYRRYAPEAIDKFVEETSPSKLG